VNCTAVTVWWPVACVQRHGVLQTFPLRDTTGLSAPKVKTEAVKYLGRESVRITVDGEDTGPGPAAGNRLQRWSHRGGYRVEITTPPGVKVSRLCRIAFRRGRASHCELFT